MRYDIFSSCRTNTPRMKSSCAKILFLCSVLIGSRAALGQDYIPIFSRDYGSRLSVEVDPITFLLKGYSLHVRYQPMFTDQFLIGIGTYAMNLPEHIVHLRPANRDKGWDVRIRSAYFVTGEFYAKQANHGWFIGEQIGFQSFKISNNAEVRGKASFNNLLLMTYAGYSWHPYKGSFFVKPWVGLGFTEMVDGINKVDDLTYDVGPLFPFFTVHLGYTF